MNNNIIFLFQTDTKLKNLLRSEDHSEGKKGRKGEEDSLISLKVRLRASSVISVVKIENPVRQLKPI
jgi:hypothetical protein